MALILILGRPGSGKSYTALERYIDPALREGRRVLHNIAGFTGLQVFDAAPFWRRVASWARQRGRGGMLAPASRLVRCHNFGAVPLFPPLVLDEKTGTILEGVTGVGAVDNNPARVRGGDLLVIDEYYLVRQAAGLAFPFGGALEWQKSFAQYLRGHRHLTDGKRATDIIIMSQSDDEIPDSIRQCAERTIICKTHILGGGSLRRLYYDGFRKVAVAKAENAVEVENYKPSPALCARYASYTGGAVRERFKGFGFMLLARRNLFLTCCLLAGFAWGIPKLLSGELWGGSVAEVRRTGEEVRGVVLGGGAAVAPVVWERDWQCRVWLDGKCLVEY